jgi:predicted DNA binding CopG/RHH family protein
MSNADEIFDMPAEVDFSESVANPYAGKTRKRITINIDASTLDYFKDEAARTGVPYQTIINLYLAECRQQNKRLTFA